MIKHPYNPDCTCVKCVRERARRTAQSLANPQRSVWGAQQRKPRKPRGSRKPVYGSAEWAETRGDDLGESPDY